MKKNLNAIITNSILIGLGVLFVCFMAGTYIPGLATGYDLLQFLQLGFSFSSTTGMAITFFSIGSLISLIAMCLVVALAVVNLLVALNVIKVQALAKVFGKLISVLAGLAFAGIVLVFAGYFVLTEAASFGWAMILNIILVVATIVVSFYCKVVAKKAAKQAAKESKE